MINVIDNFLKFLTAQDMNDKQIVTLQAQIRTCLHKIKVLMCTHHLQCMTAHLDLDLQAS